MILLIKDLIKINKGFINQKINMKNFFIQKIKKKENYIIENIIKIQKKNIVKNIIKNIEKILQNVVNIIKNKKEIKIKFYLFILYIEYL